ncbi:MAG: hypothetical protein CMM47_10045 [Rhodospirillaceae bacterium]|nr:hypothetical protein [Rhodospirillaceae bacterium]
MDPRQIVLAFAESMTALMDILNQENEVIATCKYIDLEPLQPRKVALARQYSNAQGCVENDLGVLESLSEEERTDLRALYKNFRRVLSENMLALRGAHDASERVVNIIIDAIKQQRGVKTAPSAFGPRTSGYAAYSTPATASIALSTET